MSDNLKNPEGRQNSGIAPWYYALSGERLGPISSRELKVLAEAGEITPETLVWKHGLKDWVPARRIKNLFSSEALRALAERETLAELSRGTAMKECPFCAEHINANARKCRHCGELIPTGSQIACPSCRRVLPPGTKVCVACGYDFGSGQRLEGALAHSPAAGSVGRSRSSASRQQQLLTMLLGAVILVGASQFAKVANIFGGGASTIGTSTGKIIVAAATVLALGTVACLVQRKSLALIVSICGIGGLFMATWWGYSLYRLLTLSTDPDLADNSFAAAFTTQIGPGLGMYGTVLGGIVTAVCATMLWLGETSLPSASVRNVGLATIYVVGIGSGVAIQRPWASHAGDGATAGMNFEFPKSGTDVFNSDSGKRDSAAGRGRTPDESGYTGEGGTAPSEPPSPSRSDSSGFKIIEIDARMTSSNEIFVEVSWKVRLQNLTGRSQGYTTHIKFLDDDDFLVLEDFGFDLRLGAHETDTFSYQTMTTPDKWRKVARYNVQVQRR